MNTIQTQTALSVNSPSATANVPKNNTILAEASAKPATLEQDHYSAIAANDAVIARVISSSISRSFGNVSTNDHAAIASATLDEKFTTEKSEDVSGVPNMDTVTANVVGFVKNALANLAKRGFDQEQLSFFRNEAISGVEVGIEQAKLELIGIANDDLFKTIDNTKVSIIGGINKLPVDPLKYENVQNTIDKPGSGTNRALSAIEVTTNSNDFARIDFETRAFNAGKAESNRSVFTTSSSNISFAVQGDLNESARLNLANFINKADGLANSFYRGEIELAYRKSQDLGYSDNEIAGLATQLNRAEKSYQIKTYGDIEHLNIDTNNTDFAAPKAVAEYINKYLDVMESGKNSLNDEKDFNQVINGLVNQMKDVQVPDLLQAINRFHSFNQLFSQ